MPKIERKDQEDLTSVLTVKVEKSEYEPKFKSELVKFKNTAALKGFRKGKTPMSFIKKMYGERILIDIVNELLGEAVNKYLEEEKLDILGAPIPSKDQEEVRFNPNELIDYEFKYQLGLRPQIELKGLSEKTKLDRFDVQVPDTMIDDEIDRMLKQGGEQVDVDGPVSENDIMKFKATEMDGDEPKENGLTSEFTILYDTVTDEYKEKFGGQMIGAVVRADVFSLEDKTDEKYVRKYFLNLQDDDDRLVGHWYDLELVEIRRIEKAEMGEALFNKYFGEGVVKTEEEARERFRNDIKAYFDSSADGLFFKTVMDFLFEQNTFALPENFLKNWIGFNSPSMKEADIEKSYPEYSDAMKHRIITSKLIDTYELAVTEAELLEAIKNRFRGYLGGMGGNEEMLDSLAKNYLTDEKYQDEVEKIAEEIVSDKILKKVKEVIKINDVSISSEDFQEEVKRFNASLEQEIEADEQVAETVDEE